MRTELRFPYVLRVTGEEFTFVATLDPRRPNATLRIDVQYGIPGEDGGGVIPLDIWAMVSAHRRYELFSIKFTALRLATERNGMSTHTDGLWEAQENVVFADPSGGPACGVVVASCGDGEGNETQFANARLIAASPDLLSACELALQVTGGSTQWDGETKRFLEAIEAAVKKARGQ